jgi:dethiobiotin synthetase
MNRASNDPVAGADAGRVLRGLFVAGTDTGVGKTLAACALLHELRRRGLRCVGMKPVAAGVENSPDGPANGDVLDLRRASSWPAPLCEVNPYCFDPPIAPHLAAHEAGVRIELDRIVRAFRALQAQADAVVVEGVGGFLVPLNEREDAGDLARALGLPVVLVIGMRLGCLNHALLTLQAIGARSLLVAGWIANTIDPHMARFEQNLQALRERIDAPCLGVLPFQAPPDVASMRLQLPAAAD